MKFKLTLSSLVLLAFVVGTWIDNTHASVDICFKKNGKTENRTFESKKVTYQEARESLQLTENDIFKCNGRVIERSVEEKLLVENLRCNEVISQNQESSIEVCILDDQCTTIILENSAKVGTLRDKLLASLPQHYGNEKCADISFLDYKSRVIQHSEEGNVPYQNIVKDGVVKARNEFIDNTTELDITWLLSSHRVRVNMLKSLSNLRYWLTKPTACPNLKGKLNLPDKPLFPNPSDDSAQNWLARDKYAELNKVPAAHLVSSQLVAPFDKEQLLPINSYTYKIEASSVQRLYYVNVAEKNKAAFTGSRTEVFNGNYLTVKVSSRSPKKNILLAMKDLRSTNNRAVPWTNVVITTNNTAVTVDATWDNPQSGYAYRCTLFDFRANYAEHILFDQLSENGVCDVQHIYDKDSHTSYNLLFNAQQLIENGENLAKFRYELGVTLYPYRPGTWECGKRTNRKKKSIGNVDIHQDHITMGGAGQGDNAGNVFNRACTVIYNNYSEENRRSLHFNVFIFKSQEIAERIIEDVPIF